MDAAAHVREALVRIQIEYVQMPQLKLTARQVQRLWSLSSDVCDAVLSALLLKEFLVQAADGSFVRCAKRQGIERLGALSRAS